MPLVKTYSKCSYVCKSSYCKHHAERLIRKHVLIVVICNSDILPSCLVMFHHSAILITAYSPINSITCTCNGYISY